MGVMAAVCLSLMRGASDVPVPAYLDKFAAKTAVFALSLYQRFISPLSGKMCLFRISCSEFAKDAISREGWTAGKAAALERLRQCGGSYTISIDVKGRTTLVTGDGSQFTDGDIAPWVSPHRRWNARKFGSHDS